MINPEQLGNDISKEVLLIILNSSEEIQKKIPSDLINKLTTLAADSTKNINFIKGKRLDEQNISKESLDIFAVLYYYYVADNEEKKELISKWKENENK